MTDKSDLLNDLVAANRILAHEGVVDGYGHVSVRHPDRPECFLLARSRSPELVELNDLLEFGPDGEPVKDNGPAVYKERYIHAAIYAARPDVLSVVHNHSEELLPFGVTGEPLRPVFHTAARIGPEVPVWDIADKFGDTDMLVTNMDQGNDLAAALGGNRIVLMRGHGATVAMPGLQFAVTTSIYAQANARVQLQAMAMGRSVKYLSAGELAETGDLSAPNTLGAQRTWEYYCRRAGCDGH
ncbi:MAG: class II aldolase/adducin family protein [Rhodospirillaceae bacterium]|jgi:ribulose-5-phosphate 4-epimerase/fuculose-1-phosphate aldolase|nr:class II aldolase/adducin family protein [Rhodospirillaceae bacterium]